VAEIALTDPDTPRAMEAYPVQGGKSLRLCAPACGFQRDAAGKFLYITPEEEILKVEAKAYVSPLAKGQVFPPIVESGIRKGTRAFG